MGSSSSASRSSNSSVSSKSSNSSNMQSIAHSNLQMNIDDLSKEESLESIKTILRIRVPFFDNPTIQTLANITYITGNGPFHEGLIFETRNGTYYIAQTYPITFIMVNSLNEGIREIVSFCQFNPSADKYEIYNSYYPIDTLKISDIKDLVKNMPNEYNILNENCQKFCQKIISALNLQIQQDIQVN